MKTSPMYPFIVAMGLAMAAHVEATPLFWDANGATAGAGATPSGTWGSSAFWNTDSAGGAGSFTNATAGSDNLTFVAGPDSGSGNNGYAITVSGTPIGKSITFQSSGAATVSGGTAINLFTGNMSVPAYAYGTTANALHTITTPISLGDPAVGSGTFTSLWSTASATAANYLTLGGSVSKANAGTTWSLSVTGGNDVYFNTAASQTTPFSTTTVDGGSTLRLNGAFATGNYSFGSSGSTITLDNNGRFLIGSTSSSAPLTVQNAWSVGSGGGRIATYRPANPNERWTFSGNATLGGDLSITVGYGGSGNSTWTGGFALIGANRTLTISSGGNGALNAMSGNLTQDTAGRSLTLTAGSTTGGENRIIAATWNTTVSAMVLSAGSFASPYQIKFGSSALPTTSLTIGAGTYAGIDFTPADQSTMNGILDRITSSSTGVLGLDANIALNIDLASRNLNLRIGSSDGSTYTGTLTPFGSTYKLGGAAGTLTLSSANALTGQRALSVGTEGNLYVANAVALNNDNNFAGDATVDIGRTPNFRPGVAYHLQSTVSGNNRKPFGLGTLVIKRGSVRSAPGSNSDTTITNAVTFGGAGEAELQLIKNAGASSSLQWTAPVLTRDNNGGLFLFWQNGTLGGSGYNPRLLITGQTTTNFFAPYVVVGDGSGQPWPRFAQYDAANGLAMAAMATSTATPSPNDGTVFQYANAALTLAANWDVQALRFGETGGNTAMTISKGTGTRITLRSGGLITHGTGAKTIASDLTFGADGGKEAVIWASGGQTYSLTGGTILSGNLTASGLTKCGTLLKSNDAGTGRTMLVLSGTANAIAGRVAVSEGGIAITAAGALTGANTVMVGQYADAYFNVDETIRGLEGPGGVGSSLNGSGSFTRVLTLDTAGGNYSAGVTLRDESTASSRYFALTKTGNGTQVLTGDSTYTGATTVNGGALLIDGALSSATATVTVNNGGILGGTGQVLRPVTANAGAMLTGASTGTVGRLQIGSEAASRDLAVAATTTLYVDFSATTNDLIQVFGSLTGSDTVKVAINGANGTNAVTPTSQWTLLRYTGSCSVTGATLSVVGGDWSLLTASLVNDTGNKRLYVTGLRQMTAPSVTNLEPANVESRTATLRGELLGGGPSYVWVYWGGTNQFDDKDAWDFTNEFGEVAEQVLTHDLSFLTPGQEYFYRFYASNQVNDAWATPTRSFSTSVGGRPSVLANTATNLTVTTADLVGTLVSTGGSATTVTLYWGDSPTLTNSVPLGQRSDSEVFTNTISVGMNTTYYYAFYAANTEGSAWSATNSFVSSQLKLEANLPSASEKGIAGQFRLTRPAALQGSPWTIPYRIEGTASNGVDYTLLSGSVSMPAGETTAYVTVNPVYDAVAEGGSQSVVLTVLPSASYVRDATPATVNIADFLATVTVGVPDATASEVNVADTGRVTFTRDADFTNVALQVNFTVGGTATEVYDYQALARQVTIGAGQTSNSVTITAIYDRTVELVDETVILSLAAGLYAAGTPNSGQVTITPDALIAASTLIWDGTQDAVWDAGGTKLNFHAPGGPAGVLYFLNGDGVVFGNTGAGTVTLSGTVQPASVVMSNTSTYAFQTGVLGGSGSLTQSGSGITRFTSVTVPQHGGGTVVSNGVVSWQTGGGTAWFGTSGSSIQLRGGKFRWEDTAVQDTFYLQNPISVLGSGTIEELYNNNAGDLYVDGDISGSGALSLLTTGGGSLRLRGNNSGFAGTLSLPSTGGAVAFQTPVAVPGGVSQVIAPPAGSTAPVWFGGADAVYSNDVVLAGSAILGTYNGAVRTLAGNLTVGNNNLTMSGGNGLFILNPRAGKSVSFGTGTLTVGDANNWPGLNPVVTSQLPTGNLNLTGRGLFVLDGSGTQAPSWAAFTAHYSSGYGSGSRQWRRTVNNGAYGGFAAVGSPVTIPAGEGGQTTSTWDPDLMVGANAAYCNAGITFMQPTTFTASRDWVIGGRNTAALTGWTMGSVVHEYAGYLSDGAATGRYLQFNNGWGGGTMRISCPTNDLNGTELHISGLSDGGGLAAGGGTQTAVSFTSDGAFGNSPLVIVWAGRDGGNGNHSAMLLLEDTNTVGSTTFDRTLTVALRRSDYADDTAGGIGALAGDVVFTGLLDVQDRPADGGDDPMLIQVEAGSTLTMGTADNSAHLSHKLDPTGNGVRIDFRKTGTGELRMRNFTWSYDGAGTPGTWIMRLYNGTLHTMTNTTTLASGATVDWDDMFNMSNIARTWRVSGVSQSLTFAEGQFQNNATVDVTNGLTLTTTMGSAAELYPNGATAVLAKRGAGTWVYSNPDAAVEALGSAGGEIKVSEGTFDTTGDMGNTALRLDGGTLLCGALSQFTGSSGQDRNLYVNATGGKIGISAAAAANVSRAAAVTGWDQGGASTLTLAARNSLNLVFANAAFPDVLAGNTLMIERDGSGTGVVQINDTAVSVDGVVGGSGELKLGATGTGTLTVTGTAAPGSSVGTLTVDGDVAFGGNAALEWDLDTPSTSDKLAVNGDLTLDGLINLTNVGGMSSNAPYTVMTYTGTLTDNGMQVGVVHGGAFIGTIDTNTPQEVRIVLQAIPPEPTVVNLGGVSNVLANSAYVGGRLVSTGQAATAVWLFWDTGDKGTGETNAWTWWKSVGPKDEAIAPFYTLITNLTENTTYAYRYYAENIHGHDWSDTYDTFRTVRDPVVANSTATSIGVGGATLNGTLSGDPATVRFYWGADDKGMTTGGWDHVETVGSIGTGTFSKAVSGMLYGVTYAFRAYATNSAGEAWGDPEETVRTETPALHLPVINNLRLWLKADAGVTRNGSDVTQWTDQSGNGFHATPPAAANRPTYVAADPLANSRPVINFNGTDEGLRNSAWAPQYRVADGGVDEMTYFFVSRLLQAGGSNFGFLSQSTASGTDYSETGGLSIEDSIEYVHESQNTGVSRNTAAYNLDTLVDTADSSDTTGKAALYLNGTFSANHQRSMAHEMNPTRYAIASRGAGTANFGNMNFAEILIYNRALSSDEQAAVGGYLEAKYGLNTAYPAQPHAPIVVSNTVPTEVGTRAATLNGTYYGTGSVFHVYALWGTNNGGQTWNAWSNKTLVASYTNVVSTNLECSVSNLLPNTFYHATFAASNDVEVMWAPAATNFTTYPLPTVNNDGGATNVTGDAADLRGVLVTNGNSAADVYVFWGTSNGMTTATSWASNALLASGVVGADSYTHAVSNLLPSTWYFYRFYATNATEQGWATSSSTFKTAIGAGWADIDNDGGPSNITATSADLNGTYITDGGDPATRVYLYWGQTNGGTNKGDWTETDLGTFATTPTAVVYNASLQSNAVYYYRYMASNVTHETWAPDVKTLNTHVVHLDVTDAAASEVGPDNGAFRIWRHIDAAGAPVTIAYTVGGSAANGTDYTAIPAQVTLGTGVTETNLVIAPIPDEDYAEGAQTVILALQPGDYVIGTPDPATVTIADATTDVLRWDNQSGNGTWDTSSANWHKGLAANGTATFADNVNSVVFGAAPGGTITLSGTVQPTATTVEGTYTFQTGTLGGTGIVTKTGSGTLTVTKAPIHSGGTTIAGGTIMLENATSGTAFGSGAVSLDSGIYIRRENVGTIIDSSTFSVGAGGGSIRSSCNNNGNSGTIKFSGAIGGSGPLSLVLGVNPGGSSSMTLSGGNTGFSGTMAVSRSSGSGSLNFETLASLGGGVDGSISWSEVNVPVSVGFAATALQLAKLNPGPNCQFAIDNNTSLDLSAQAWANKATVRLSAVAAQTVGVITPVNDIYRFTTGGGNLTFDTANRLTDGTGARSVNFYASTQGGSFILSAAQNYSGGTTIAGGTVDVRTSSPLGTSAVIQSGGTLLLSPQASAIEIAHAITVNGGTIRTDSDNKVSRLTGPIALNSSFYVSQGNGNGKGTLIWSGNISGSGKLIQSNGGSSGSVDAQVLAGDNSAWTGGFRHDGTSGGGGASHHLHVRGLTALGGAAAELYSDQGHWNYWDENLSGTLVNRVNLAGGTTPFANWALGPGLGEGSSGIVRSTGNWSGTGATYFNGRALSDTQVSEFVLAGTNTWSGAVKEVAYTTGRNFVAGPGGLLLGVGGAKEHYDVLTYWGDIDNLANQAVGAVGFVRFERDASLNSGGAGTAYYAALSKPGVTTTGRFGFLLTGGHTYDAPSGKQFVIGSLGAGTQVGGTLGAAGGGTATLNSTTINIHGDANTDVQELVLFSRGTGDVLALGTGGAVSLRPTTGDSGLATTTTAMLARNGGGAATTLAKRGAGTVKIDAVQFTHVGGAANDARGTFTWTVTGGTLEYSQNDTGLDPFAGVSVSSTGVLNVPAAGVLKTAAVNASSGGLVQGTGAIAGSATIGAGGALAGGADADGLGTGNLDLQAGSELRVAISGAQAAKVRVTGTVKLGGALVLSGDPGVDEGRYLLIDNDGTDAVDGTFAGQPDANYLSVNGTRYRITYHGGDGNDVQLYRIKGSVMMMR